MTGRNAQRENIATFSTCSETQATNSGKQTGIFICPLIVVAAAFQVDTLEAEMACGRREGIALTDLSAGGQIEGATAVRGIITARGAVAAERGAVAAGRGAVAAERDAAGRDGVAAERDGVAVGRGEVIAGKDTIKTGKGGVIVELEREGYHGNHY